MAKPLERASFQMTAFRVPVVHDGSSRSQSAPASNVPNTTPGRMVPTQPTRLPLRSTRLPLTST
eukprot:1183945-Prorocentrum_minimum.AAC.1